MEERHVHWSELLGNKFRFGLCPQMLTGKGYKLKTVTIVRGESKSNAVPVVVNFDEDYAVEYLARILGQLRPRSYNDFQRIVSKAYARWHEKEKQDK
jgi:hypothetical protein